LPLCAAYFAITSIHDLRAAVLQSDSTPLGQLADPSYSDRTLPSRYGASLAARRGPLPREEACLLQALTRTCRNFRYPVVMGWQADLEEAVLNMLDL
jgi:hypothetical protein